MDFFSRQDQARRHTKLLVFYFVVAVILLIAAVYFAVLIIFVGAKLKTHSGLGAGPLWWHPQLFCGVATGTLAIIVIGSVSKTLELSQGGSAVASMLGGRLLHPNTADPDERKLLNVVEEMAIA